MTMRQSMGLRAGLWHCAAVVVLFALGAGLALGGENAAAVVKRICRGIYVEGPTEDDLQRDTAQIAALGEPGRKALVKLSRSLSTRPTTDGGVGTEGDQAMEFLIRLEDPRALSIARDLLSRRNAAPELKERGLWVVTRYRDTASAARVLELFRSDTDRDVVREAMRALSAFGDEASRRVLREALLDPRYKHLRGDLVKAVSVSGHEEAVDILVNLLSDPVYRDHEDARANLMSSLSHIGTPHSVEQAVAIARTLDPTKLSSEMRLRDLVDIFKRQRSASRDPEEIARLDALIRELDPSLRKPN